jgi:hypothetical protein
MSSFFLVRVSEHNHYQEVTALSWGYRIIKRFRVAGIAAETEFSPGSYVYRLLEYHLKDGRIHIDETVTPARRLSLTSSTLTRLGGAGERLRLTSCRRLLPGMRRAAF